MIDYRKVSEGSKKAWVQYAESQHGNPRVVDFHAGYNAAKVVAEKLNDDNVIVNKGALQMVFNVLERDGGIRQEIADELREACKLIEI
jgi:hypothetical protein